MERVHFWKAYWTRVSDTQIYTPLKIQNKTYQIPEFCSLKALLYKPSTQVNEIMRFSRFGGGVSKSFSYILM